MACRAGQHAPLVEGDTVEYDGCVNVEWVCVRCGVVVEEVSYTREEWERRRDEIEPGLF